MTASLEDLVARLEQLERRVDELETGGGARTRSRSSASSSGDGASLNAAGWTEPYSVAPLEVSETWIELHEPSARPQLQRLVREVVQHEGPVTERLALDRVRRAWGLRRAGGRVQEAFDQAVRQLVARSLVERDGDALVEPGGGAVTRVRVPSDDEATKRGAEDVPLSELALALQHAIDAHGGRAGEDDVTMQVAKLFGWTRRGGAIQSRMDAAINYALNAGILTREGSNLALSA